MAKEQAPNSGHAIAGACTELARLRVLVADDNPVNRVMTLRMIEQIGGRGTAVADGMEALAAHRATAFDLILMDCDMPRLDGYAATARLRAEETSVRTPVLALTAFDGPLEEEKCRQAGMDGLLSKPLSLTALRDALLRWGGTAAADVSAATPADELEAVRTLFGRDFAELASLYQLDGLPRIGKLRLAHANGDHAGLARTAHTFCGSSASIGATGLSAMCGELEASVRAATLDDFAARITEIEAEFRRVSARLQALLAE
jgi:CheY-like chemotaxis protein